MSSIVKFVTSFGSTDIRRIEVARETAASVFLVRAGVGVSKKTERREAKVGTFSQYHDTWELAHKYLIQQAEIEVAAARRQLEKVSGKLGNIKGKPVGKVSK